MNLVQPIRDTELLKEIKEYLKGENERDYILFLLGIHTGFRISDILGLRVRDVEGWAIYIQEGKTKKHREVHMPSELKRELREYVKDKPKNEYLIRSRKGKNKPITRVRAYQILNDMAKKFGLKRIGTHSLRKTYGYHHYNAFKDVVALQEAFNHTDPKVTLRYIGMHQDKLNDYQKKIRW